jgi:hypothetical protein
MKLDVIKGTWFKPIPVQNGYYVLRIARPVYSVETL